MTTHERLEEIRSALCDWNKPSKMASVDLEENVKKVAHLIDQEVRKARIDELEKAAQDWYQRDTIPRSRIYDRIDQLKGEEK